MYNKLEWKLRSDILIMIIYIYTLYMWKIIFCL